MTMTKIKKKLDFIIPRLSEKLKTEYSKNIVYRTVFRKEKKKINISFRNNNLTNSAVLCLLIISEKEKLVNVILTLRSKKLKKHSGQISFPGGKLEKKDADYESCALRETFEEIGINRKNINIIGKINKYSTGTGFLIQPIIAMISKDFVCKINYQEVDEIITFPINHLFLNKNLTTSHYLGRIDNKQYFYYDIKWKKYRIWGATAMILVDLSKIIKSTIKRND